MSLCVQLEAGGLSVGREAEGTEALWAEVEGEAARMRTRFDRAAGCWVSACRFLSDQPLVPPPGAERILALLQLLRDRRCLLVLDNLDTLFEPSHHDGRYRQGMGPYGRLLQAVGEAAHQSCLVLTSREAPSEPGA